MLIIPDEGICLQVLHTAARNGLPELAADVLRVFKLMDVPWQEHHFAPLIEAFCRAEETTKAKDAFLTLDIMRGQGVIPTQGTTAPIMEMISVDVDALDRTWSILDELLAEGKTIDVSALNVIIEASVALNDLQRAVGAYKSFSTYQVKPSAETYTFLLDGCILASHRELGDKLLSDMKEAGLKPITATYEKMIMLCLTQETYEDAFFYLEEMKAAGHLPPLELYEAMVERCVQAGDGRFKLVLEEVKECGYDVSRQLQRVIDDGARQVRVKRSN